MKKTLLVALAVWVCHTASAQVSYGVTAGINFSTVTEQIFIGPSPEFVAKKGFYGGLTGEYRFGKRWGLAAEFCYSRQGAEVKWTRVAKSMRQGGWIDYDELREKERLNYLVMPVILRFYPLRRLALEAGPQFGYAVGADEFGKGTTSADPSYGINETVIKIRETLDRDAYNHFDAGVTLGVSWEFMRNVSASARAYVGMLPYGDESDARNILSRIGLSYRFR